MEREKLQSIFEAYFEKYQKTEGDRTSWSAFWAQTTPQGVLELNMTKCPKGTTFKIFVDNKKFAEVSGWQGYFGAIRQLEEQYPGLYDEDTIFSEMEFVI